MQFDCVVAGAGPAGCVSARELARAGFTVLMLEEHSEIGEPVHCTGIVGEKLSLIQPVPESCVISRIDKVKVLFPRGNPLILPTPIKPLLIDRSAFDKHLFTQAVQAGVKTITGARVENVTNHENGVTVKYSIGSSEEQVEAGICVIATGALSGLPAKLGFSGVEHMYYSAQVEIEIDDVDGIELYPGGEYAPGSFAYVVSVDDSTAKAGLIVKGNIKEKFDAFLNSPMLKPRIKSILHSPVYRLMPLGLPGKTVDSGIMIVGDAACQLKSTTGGGIYYGIRCAHLLADAVKSAKTQNGFDYSKLRAYEKNWRREFSFEIGAGIFLRKYLENRDDKWWEKVSEALLTDEAVKLVSEYKDFDSHKPFITEFFKRPAILRLLLDFTDFGFFNKKEKNGKNLI
ncbi:MAG: NAD(P)/FAD-dependent oxidoreductase [Firmicutes bacterium]|nr:NAD(P)/FAD-dependent oxidoreductase [Bacillota bacterium]